MISFCRNYENPSRIKAAFGPTEFRGFHELLDGGHGKVVNSH